MQQKLAELKDEIDYHNKREKLLTSFSIAWWTSTQNNVYKISEQYCK